MRLVLLLIVLIFVSCEQKKSVDSMDSSIILIEPDVITEMVPHDTDDPAIWINPVQVEQSLILGTDKEIGGGIYAFNLKGQIIDSLTLKGINYPNNIDLLKDFKLPSGKVTDIITFTERESQRIRIYSFPELEALDGGGLPVFDWETVDSLRKPMGIAFYHHLETDESYIIVSRKNGPKENYLAQYLIVKDEIPLRIELRRKFGEFSGGEEIEAIMVDQEKGYIYYSDESYGIRKYAAYPENGSGELLTFGKSGFKEDREGIALWPTDTLGNGYIIVSNQQDNSFNVYDRNTPHKYVGKLPLSTIETDGCEVYPYRLNDKFPKGIFVAMTEGKTFHFYSLEKLLANLIQE